MKRFAKRAGIVAFIFFTIKGLVWLVLLISAGVWAGGAGAPDAQTGPAGAFRASAPAPNDAELAAERLPMHLGDALSAAARSCGECLAALAHDDAAPTRAAMATVGLGLLLVALRIRACQRPGVARSSRV